ncbi:hypothetical protein FHS18_000539 [Paenibacillus phyllosphaerae]|uniref:Uncharacterized protein n=1 Tax=Paenibacillus phyllosphaerae TaxID=274593 RepID=A0A7W5AUH6_9BACL|nr:hypothetical protein [Paenibacillus phyllosphaerae]MBB3108511.1 hypothetical protein [Paenibacillus phyllosphaerae]
MASTKVRPKLNAPSKGKVLKTRTPLVKRLQTGPYLNRLTVLWVQTNGVTFNTTGFFARVFRGNTLIATAFFDRFGVVQFANIGTLTTANLTVRIFNSQGVQFRSRSIPAGSEAFAVIG